jgi:arylsulfatase A-like enzyme
LAEGTGSASFDAQLGRVLEFLEENGLRDNTILVVLGRSPDHVQSVTPARPPPTATDAPIPVVMHIPGEVYAPGPITQLTRLQDLAPTLLDVLGLPAGPSMEGVSLRPALENRESILGLAAFGENAGFPTTLPGPNEPPSARAIFRGGVSLDPASGYRVVLNDPAAALRRKHRWVRTSHWQLVFTPAEASPEGVDQWQLFDLRSDPATTRDVKLQNPKVWQTLEVALRRWADEKKESRIHDLFPEGEPAAAVLPGT